MRFYVRSWFMYDVNDKVTMYPTTVDLQDAYKRLGSLSAWDIVNLDYTLRSATSTPNILNHRSIDEKPVFRALLINSKHQVVKVYEIMQEGDE